MMLVRRVGSRIGLCRTYFDRIFFRLVGDCFYNVTGSKHVSRYDNADAIDVLPERGKISLIDFFKSPEYQMIKASTPTPAYILDSFYDYSPPWKPKEKGALEKYNIKPWTPLQLDRFHKMTDFLWYLSMNGLVNKTDIERISYNLSIAEMTVNEGIKAIILFEGMKPALNICSLAMYEYIFHDKPITTEELYQLALALGKVKHSLDTLTLPLVSILHKKPLQVDERIKLFLAISRLEPNINLIEFYTFTGFCSTEMDVLKLLCMDTWVQSIKKKGSEEYQLSRCSVAPKPQKILQLLNGLSNLTIEWLVGSVHKRIELKRLWDTNFTISPDKIYTYRTPLEIFCKTLLAHLMKCQFRVLDFYVIEEDTANYPIYGGSLSHVIDILYQIGIDILDSTEYSSILLLIEQLTPTSLTDIIEFIKPIKKYIKISEHLLECFIRNVENNIPTNDEATEKNEVKELPKELNKLFNIINKENNNKLEKRLTKLLSINLIDNI